VEHYNAEAYYWESPTRDRLGSIRAARRYPFGEGINADTDEFATYRNDTSTQPCYAWSRFYSATWGRFSSPDPYLMSGGLTNPQGWNRYSYVANDPVNYYDRLGLYSVYGGESRNFCDVYSDHPECSPYPQRPVDRPIWLSDFGGLPEVFDPDTLASMIMGPAQFVVGFGKFKAGCERLLEKLGTSVEALQSKAKSLIIREGMGSTALIGSLYAGLAEAAGRARQAYEDDKHKTTGWTIGQEFALNPKGTAAMAVLFGNEVYVNTALVGKWDVKSQAAMLFHETLHVLTGMTDDALQYRLGLKNEPNNTKNISDKIKKECLP